MPFVFTVNQNQTDITYEAETVAEGMAIRTSAEMVKALQDLATVEGTPTTAESTPPADNTTAVEPAKKRGRPAKNQPAPETATAPPPAPIPTVPVPPVPPLATAPAPVPPAPAPAADDGSIPPFLKRDAAPPAPPVPPPAAPSIILGPKIRAHIEATATDDATKKQYLDWLASPGIGLVIPNVSWDEAMGVLQYTTDAQCGGVAKALGVS